MDNLSKADGNSKLVSKFFGPEYFIARIKCESVVVNCIIPMNAAELRQELDKADFVFVTCY